jgi:hypothetical protein
MKTIKLTLTAFILCSLLFVSCKKEPGPKGDTGAAGAANKQTYTFTVHPSNWMSDSINGQWFYNYSVNVNAQSAVSGYIQTPNSLEALPYHDNASNIRYQFGIGTAQPQGYIQVQATNLGTATIAPTTDKNFTFVIVQ